MESVIQSLAKSVLIPLGLTAVASAMREYMKNLRVWSKCNLNNFK